MDQTIAAISHPFPEPPGYGEAREVAPGLWWLRLPLPMALDHVNAYVLNDGAQGLTVIDTGLDSLKSRAAWQQVLAGPLQGKKVWRVIATHHHPDHIGLAGWFQAQGAELWATRTAWLMARMLVLDEQPLPSAETIAFWRSAGMDAARLAVKATERPFNFADCVAPLPLGFRRLSQGDVVEMGGRRWDVHIGHGHAPDHATFWSRDDALVIGGDQLLPGISANLGTYATEPDADPVADWLESCTRLAVPAHADQLVLPGHKLPFAGLPFRLGQMIENHHAALARLYTHLATPQVAVDCFVPLFRRQIGDGEHGLALVEAVAHLNHLHQVGRITRQRRADGAWLWQQAPAQVQDCGTIAHINPVTAVPFWAIENPTAQQEQAHGRIQAWQHGYQRPAKDL